MVLPSKTKAVSTAVVQNCKPPNESRNTGIARAFTGIIRKIIIFSIA
jgi:hypothetical protein